MALRNVVTEGDPILRKKARPVTEVNDHIREIMGDMLETMRDAGGVGIAGPQVGVMRRIFVAEPDPNSEEETVYYMINPEIYEMEGELDGEEGCLSVPGYLGKVVRPERIKIRALDLDGNLQEYEFEGFDARVMCHEYDHLEGILYTDKASDVYERTYSDDEDEEDGSEEVASEAGEGEAKGKHGGKPQTKEE